ncbi:MAG: diacylglycerol kinase family protein [Breznakibacter sp.]
MNKTGNGFLKGRIKSFRYAFKGAYLLLRTEHSVTTQFLLAILSIFFGFLFDITKTEWLFQILTIGLVLSIEGLNTAVEKLCDFIHPDHHKKIAVIKDIGAGAVIFAALTALVIGLIIYIPYFYEKLF